VDIVVAYIQPNIFHAMDDFSQMADHLRSVSTEAEQQTAVSCMREPPLYVSLHIGKGIHPNVQF
jgi:hypothetical protein